MPTYLVRWGGALWSQAGHGPPTPWPAFIYVHVHFILRFRSAVYYNYLSLSFTFCRWSAFGEWPFMTNICMLRSTPRYRLVCICFPTPGRGLPYGSGLGLSRCLGPGECLHSFIC